MATRTSKKTAADRALFTYRKLTQAELVAEARARFGDDPNTWAFQCPNCKDIAVANDFPAEHRDALGQECVGRHRGALAGPPNPTGRGEATRGCDWCAFGLFSGPWEIEMPNGKTAASFPLAPATVQAGGE